MLEARMLKDIAEIHLKIHYIKPFIKIHLFQPESLHDIQKDYQMSKQCGGTWEEGWFVIGHTSELGDLIVIDLSEEGYPVYRLMHGMGSWGAGSNLADSFNDFCNAIHKIYAFVKDKALKENLDKLLQPDIDGLLTTILDSIDSTDIDEWRYLLSPLIDGANEREVELGKKVKALSSQGMGLADIGKALELPLKSVYRYYKA